MVLRALGFLGDLIGLLVSCVVSHSKQSKTWNRVTPGTYHNLGKWGMCHSIERDIVHIEGGHKVPMQA